MQHIERNIAVNYNHSDGHCSSGDMNNENEHPHGLSIILLYTYTVDHMPFNTVSPITSRIRCHASHQDIPQAGAHPAISSYSRSSGSSYCRLPSHFCPSTPRASNQMKKGSSPTWHQIGRERAKVHCARGIRDTSRSIETLPGIRDPALSLSCGISNGSAQRHPADGGHGRGGRLERGPVLRQEDHPEAVEPVAYSARHACD